VAYHDEGLFRTCSKWAGQIVDLDPFSHPVLHSESVSQNGSARPTTLMPCVEGTAAPSPPSQLLEARRPVKVQNQQVDAVKRRRLRCRGSERASKDWPSPGMRSALH
jgi:hypothetical protein